MFRLWPKRPPAASITLPTPTPPASATPPIPPRPPYVHGGMTTPGVTPGEVFGLQIKFIWFFIRGHWRLLLISAILIAIAAIRLPKDIPRLLTALRSVAASPTPTVSSPPLPTATSLIVPVPGPSLLTPLFPTVSTSPQSSTQPSPSLFFSLPPSPLTSSQPTPTPVEEVPTSIQWQSVPAQIISGQPFTVSWQVDGTSGSRGEVTQVTIDYNATTQNGGNIHQEFNRSFTEFILPRTFSATFTITGPPGNVVLTASATANDQPVSVTTTVATQ